MVFWVPSFSQGQWEFYRGQTFRQGHIIFYASYDGNAVNCSSWTNPMLSQILPSLFMWSSTVGPDHEAFWMCGRLCMCGATLTSVERRTGARGEGGFHPCNQPQVQSPTPHVVQVISVRLLVHWNATQQLYKYQILALCIFPRPDFVTFTHVE